MDEQERARLERMLGILEQEYPDQTPFQRRQDLREINGLRARLGLAEVDARLQPRGAAPPPPAPAPAPEAQADPHAEAREIWATYEASEARLAPARAHCSRVIKATAPRQGQTPVRPLRFMGKGGGPVRCDQCHKEIRLEGHAWNGQPVSRAWDMNPKASQSWCNYILGGVTFLTESNGTLRVLHGYMDRPGCCSAYLAAQEQAQRDFRAQRSEADQAESQRASALLRALLREERGLQGGDLAQLVLRVQTSLFGYDAGAGINGP